MEKKRAVLVSRIDNSNKKPNIEEFKALAKAAGYDVVRVIIQKRKEDPKYNIGVGKVEELDKIIKEENIERVIFFNSLKPVQILNLKEKLRVEVIDRFQLILEIFAKHAGSREAKLQIELAKLRYELPRIREWVRRAKMRELPGFVRGPGSYQVDVYYKSILRRITKIRRELEEIRKHKSLHRKVRKSMGFPLIVLTGYTNAGKTTLFNRLTKESKPVSNIPFSTLATVTRLIDINGRKALISDTIGFIDNLPPLLIESFYTTLEEIRYADLLLMVIDSSEPVSEIKRKIRASIGILGEVGVISRPTIAVLNKIDLISEEELKERINIVREYYEKVVPLSAQLRINMNLLKRTIYNNLPKYERIVLKVQNLNDIDFLGNFKFLKINNIVENDDGVLLEIEGPEETLMKLHGYLRSQNKEIVIVP